MNNDAQMLDILGGVMTSLQVKYRLANLEDRMMLQPPLQQAIDNYSDYQGRLLHEGIITSDDDLSQVQTLAEAIQRAADRQSMLVTISRVIAFIAPRI